MRALTFNTWHGLSGQGALKIGELEPARRRQARFELQDREICDLDPDILFLQELNPVTERARFLARQLSASEVHQVDQSGLKFLGRGIPFNLCSGLAILARRSFELKARASLRLSGPPGFASDLFSWQLSEFRYAIMAEVTTPRFGRLLLCNAHLHHGMERVPYLADALDRAEKAKVISAEERGKMEAAMDLSQRRRTQELDRIFAAIDPVASEFDGILLGGDFNSSPESRMYRQILERGFVDLHSAAAKRSGDETLPTWDPPRNTENHGFAASFNYPIPVFGRAEVKAILRDFDLRPRRMDYLFARGSVARDIRHCSLWGTQPVGGLILSDHFGVLAEWA